MIYIYSKDSKVKNDMKLRSKSQTLKNLINIKFIKQHENSCENLKWEGEKKVEKYLLKRLSLKKSLDSQKFKF